MNIALGIAGGAVWLVAAFAFFRVLAAWIGILQLAPSGARLQTMFDLGFLNFPAVRQRIGDAAEQHIARYRQGFLIFFSAIGAFMALAIVMIVSGRAA